jgi:transposase
MWSHRARRFSRASGASSRAKSFCGRCDGDRQFRLALLKGVRETIEVKSANLVYLPPYGLDFNLIENDFAHVFISRDRANFVVDT